MRSDSHWTTAIVRGHPRRHAEVREFTLAPEDGATHYPTGSHLKVRVIADGRSDLRHYSLVGDAPTPDGCWRIAVKREEPGRGGSGYMWSLPVGARLEVSASGQPLRAVARRAGVPAGRGRHRHHAHPRHGDRADAARRGAFRMLYAGRSRGLMAFLDELAAELGERLEVFAEDEGRRIDLAAEFARLRPGGRGSTSAGRSP